MGFFSLGGYGTQVNPPENADQKRKPEKKVAEISQPKSEPKGKKVAQKCGHCHKEIFFAEAVQAIYCPFCGVKMDDEHKQQMKKTSMEDYLAPEVKALIKKNRSNR